MLTRFDDYPVHQTPEPVAHAGSSDRNFYDRYFFHGYTAEADLYFAAALGLYPNRRVMDASFSVVRGGRQLSVHASRLAPRERGETRVGPIAVEVEEPLRAVRLRVEPAEPGLAAELRFCARTPALEEARQTRRHEGRVFMDATRFTQLGTWEGHLEVAGERITVASERVLGCRDRSWGIRPVGEREAGAPGAPPQIFWIWSPVHFDDFCTLVGQFEDEAGRPWHSHGVVAPILDARGEAAGEPEPLGGLAHRVRWQPGTRRAAGAEIDLVPVDGPPRTLVLEPLLAFPMLGIGYLHPEWGHGMWKGESAVAGEAWDLADLDPLDPRHIHVQQLCRARLGEAEGIGVLEQLVIGPHAPSGFASLLDGAR